MIDLQAHPQMRRRVFEKIERHTPSSAHPAPPPPQIGVKLRAVPPLDTPQRPSRREARKSSQRNHRDRRKRADPQTQRSTRAGKNRGPARRGPRPREELILPGLGGAPPPGTHKNRTEHDPKRRRRQQPMVIDVVRRKDPVETLRAHDADRDQRAGAGSRPPPHPRGKNDHRSHEQREIEPR